LKQVKVSRNLCKPSYWIKSIIQRYNDLKLKQKFLVILLMYLGVVCSISLLALNYSFKSYDSQLYTQLSQVLNLSLLDIENNIENIEKQSLNMALDKSNQEQLEKIKTTVGDYEKYKELSDFANKIQLYSMSEKEISSISYVDTEGYDLTVGRNLHALDDSQKNKVIGQAIGQKGGLIWIEPDEAHPYFITAREILSTTAPILEPLGTLLFQINPNELFQQHLKALPYNNTEFFVLSNQKLIFSHRIHSNLDEQNIQFSNNQGYTVKRVAGKSYFMAHVTSERLGWTFVSVLPYDQIFSHNIKLRNNVILTFIVLFITAIFVALWVSKNITKPIVNLTEQMIVAEKGDLEIPELEWKPGARSDEVGYLQKRFYIMISRIHDLIEENYNKQLIIKETEYRALQAQINPHFLYNTLSSINWLARSNNQQSISMMVESLSGFLRSSIENMEAVITIREEILLLENYVTIQQFRYADKLRFSVEIDESFKEYRIPKLTLQPIVENAIRHGLENMLDVCEITVSAQVASGFMVLTVSDNGPGVDAEFLEKMRKHEVEARGTGIGLKNINERLKLLFGEPSGLSYDSKPGEGMKVYLTIPARC